jgi:hypothetical protein
MAYNNAPDYQVTQYNALSGGANNTINNIAPGSSGNFLVSNGASSQPTFQIPTVASIAGFSATPTGTTSTTYVNMGLGSSWALTPKTYGNVMISIDGTISSTTTSVTSTLILCYGTGAAPGNGTGPTGTTIGLNTIATQSAGSTNYGPTFSKTYLITSLSPGTAYWFDVQMKISNAADTAAIIGVNFTAQELIT